MKCICKDIYKINDIVVGNVGDVIKIVDAIPSNEENYEDVDGYCDITNETTGKTFNATWLDIDDTILERIRVKF